MPAFTRRNSLGGIGVALVLGGFGVWLSFSGRQSPPGQIGGPFALIDADGGSFRFADMIGKPSLVYFGFTRCPDICPTSLFLISQILARLGADADRLNVVFVTVDTERDTPAQMKAYLAAFDPRIRGLTGDKAHLAVIRDIYGIEAVPVPTTSDNYNIDHTRTVFVLDRAGRFSRGFDMDSPIEDAVAAVRAVLK